MSISRWLNWAFGERAYWDDEAYGGALKKIAHELYLKTHDPFNSTPNTAPSGQGSNSSSVDQHLNRPAIVDCQTHTRMAMEELRNRSMKYEVVLLKVTEGLWHSVVVVDGDVLDLNFAEPYDYARNYAGRYMEENNLGHVSAKEFGRAVLLLSFAGK